MIFNKKYLKMFNIYNIDIVNLINQKIKLYKCLKNNQKINKYKNIKKYGINLLIMLKLEIKKLKLWKIKLEKKIKKLDKKLNYKKY